MRRDAGASDVLVVNGDDFAIESANTRRGQRETLDDAAQVREWIELDEIAYLVPVFLNHNRASSQVAQHDTDSLSGHQSKHSTSTNSG